MTTGPKKRAARKAADRARYLRPAPAFQVYAADDLAAETYYLLSLAERGLLDAIKRGCWVSEDGTVPADPPRLAVVVRCSEEGVRGALTAAVLAHFKHSIDGARLVHEEINEQRIRYGEIRAAQSRGSAAGRRAIEEKRKLLKALGEDVAGPVTGPVLNRDEQRRDEEKRSLPSLSIASPARANLEDYLDEGRSRNAAD